MKPFRPSKSTSQSNRPGVMNYILQEDSGYVWLQNWLTDLSNVTRFRILPAMEEGQELTPLNPEATSETPLQEIIGEVFYVAEIVNMLGSKRLTYISAANADAAGEAPPGDWSPTRVTVHNLRKKIEEQIKRKGRHLPTDIPKAWFSLAEGKFPFSALPYPNELFLVQCMAIEVNGHTRKNLQTNAIEWIAPAVLALPSSATTHFLDAIKTRAAEGPLSTENNLFGDFCTCKGGHLLQLKKMTKKAQKTSGGSFTYDLYKQQQLPLDAAKAAAMWKPWEDILRVPTVEQTIQWLLTALGPEALDFGLRGTPYENYVPDDCRGTAEAIKDPVSDEDLAIEVAQFQQSFVQDVTGLADMPPGSASPAEAMPPPPPGAAAAPQVPVGGTSPPPAPAEAAPVEDGLPFETPFQELPLSKAISNAPPANAPADKPPLEVDISEPPPPPPPSQDGVNVGRYQESLKHINESLNAPDAKPEEKPPEKEA